MAVPKLGRWCFFGLRRKTFVLQLETLNILLRKARRDARAYCRMFSTVVHAAAAAAVLGAVSADDAATNVKPTFAFTYTANTQNWLTSVNQVNLAAAFVYAGDVEFYCAGSPTSATGGGASPNTTACKFTGSKPNAFVYYTDFAKSAAATYKAAGKQVFINFDGRISPAVESMVPNFSLLSASAITQFANATASLVCADPNVDGMAWDVEPFDNNQARARGCVSPVARCFLVFCLVLAPKEK